MAGTWNTQSEYSTIHKEWVSFINRIVINKNKKAVWGGGGKTKSINNYNDSLSNPSRNLQIKMYYSCSQHIRASSLWNEIKFTQNTCYSTSASMVFFLVNEYYSLYYQITPVGSFWYDYDCYN